MGAPPVRVLLDPPHADVASTDPAARPRPSTDQVLVDPRSESPVERSVDDRRRGPSKVRRSLLLGRTSGRERRLAPRLDSELAPIGAVLHGCRLRDADHRIDHLVVAPSGIWVVLADHSAGRVSFENDRLVVDGVDLSGRVSSAAFAAHRVRQALDGLGLDWLDVTPTLCFTNARLRLAGRHSMSGVRLLDARALVRDVALPGALLQADARRVAGMIVASS